MKVKLIGKDYEGEIKLVENGKEEEISKELMQLQDAGIKGLKVVEIVERDVTEHFAVKYQEVDGAKMFFGKGSQPAYAANYKLKAEKEYYENEPPRIQHPNIGGNIIGPIY